MQTTGPDGVEAGWTTTEFWTSLAISVIGLLVTLGVIRPLPQANIDAIVGLVALVAPQIVYAISRGVRKQGVVATPQPAPGTLNHP